MTVPTALSVAADAAAFEGSCAVLQDKSNETLPYHIMFFCRLQLLLCLNRMMLQPANTLYELSTPTTSSEIQRGQRDKSNNDHRQRSRHDTLMNVTDPLIISWTRIVNRPRFFQ